MLIFLVKSSIEKMRNEEFVKKVYTSESMDPNSRGRPPEKWRDTVKEHTSKRGAARGGGLNQARRLNQTRRECLNREKWRLSCCGHPLGEYSWI